MLTRLNRKGEVSVRSSPLKRVVKRNRIPSVSECLKHIVADIKRRWPSNGTPTRRPDLNAGLVPVRVLRKLRKRESLPASLVVPLPADCLDNEIHKIPSTRIVAQS